VMFARGSGVARMFEDVPEPESNIAVRLRYES